MKADFAKKFAGATLEIKVRTQTAGCWLLAAGDWLLPAHWIACCWLLTIWSQQRCCELQYVLQDEDDIPTIDIDVAQEDKGDGVTEVTITCECHMCCDLHLACFLVPDDEPLAASAGFEYKKLTTGSPKSQLRRNDSQTHGCKNFFLLYCSSELLSVAAVLTGIP
jgi:hypothetical protein